MVILALSIFVLISEVNLKYSKNSGTMIYYTTVPFYRKVLLSLNSILKILTTQIVCTNLSRLSCGVWFDYINSLYSKTLLMSKLSF